MTHPSTPVRTLNAGLLWAGGAASALVAALVAVVGILVCRGVLDIPVLAPEGDGAWGDADTVTYAFGAAVAALMATGIMHLLLMFTPRPGTFFGWIVSLATLVAVLAPFAVTADRQSQVATGAINLVVGAAIGTLVSGSGRGAVRRVPPPSGPERRLQPPPSPPQRLP